MKPDTYFEDEILKPWARSNLLAVLSAVEWRGLDFSESSRAELERALEAFSSGDFGWSIDSTAELLRKLPSGPAYEVRGDANTLASAKVFRKAYADAGIAIGWHSPDEFDAQH